MTDWTAEEIAEERITNLLRDVEILTRRAEAAEAEVGLWMDTCRKAEEQVERLKREWPEALRRQLGSAEEVIKGLEAKLAEAEKKLALWERLIGAEMPPDYKDWHQNSKAEWPDVAAASLRSRKADADLAWDTVAKLGAEVERLEGLLAKVVDFTVHLLGVYERRSPELAKEIIGSLSSDAEFRAALRGER